MVFGRPKHASCAFSRSIVDRLQEREREILGRVTIEPI